MNLKSDRIRSSIAAGLSRGKSGYIWLLKILLPVSLTTALFDYSGWIQKLDVVLEPLMKWLSLPASAAFPILIGMLTGVYGCIAVMAVLSFTVAEMTLISIFVLIAHNLVQEGIIQARSGIPFAKSTLVRIVTAVVTCMVAARFLSPEPMGAVSPFIGARELPSFLVFLQSWAFQMLGLCIKIFFIVFGIMILIELLKEFNLIDFFVRALAPVLRLMGLERQTGVLWLTGVILGLSYGGAVIVQEARELKLTSEEIEKLHLSIGINHSMIEDPFLFLPFGLNPIWLWVPRLLAAILAVFLADRWFKLKRVFNKKPKTVL